MRRHLEQRGCEPACAEGAIELLLEQGYLDDERYARLFAEDRRSLDQWGAERIRRTLLERGVERELVEATLSSSSTATEREHAIALLERRFSTPPREHRARQRALAMLLRKGYAYELALDALSAYGRSVMR